MLSNMGAQLLMRHAEIVIVLGAYRSGTSLTARLCAEMGVDFGPATAMSKAGTANPTGFMERYDVMAVNDRILKQWPDVCDIAPEGVAERVERSVFDALDLSWTSRCQRWGLKDPRHCLTLHAWLTNGILPRAQTRIIHVVRPIEAVVESFMSMTSNRVGKDEARRMLAHHADAAQWQVDNAGVPAITVQYPQLTGAPRREVERIGEFVGCTSRAYVRSAARLVGKRRALARYYARRLLVNMPARVWSRLRTSVVRETKGWQ